MVNECQHKRRMQVGEKMGNIRREGYAAICNACGQIVAPFAREA